MLSTRQRVRRILFLNGTESGETDCSACRLYVDKRLYTRKTHPEPAMHTSIRRLPAQDVHVTLTPGYRPRKQTFSRSTTD